MEESTKEGGSLHRLSAASGEDHRGALAQPSQRWGFRVSVGPDGIVLPPAGVYGNYNRDGGVPKGIPSQRNVVAHE